MSRYTDADLAAEQRRRDCQQAHEARQPTDDEPARTPMQRAQFEAHLERLIAAAGETA